MLRAIFLFELRQQLTRRSTLFFFALLFVYAGVLVARAGGLLGAPFDLLGDGASAALNSAAVVHLVVTVPSAFGILLVAALVVGAACRDIRHGSWALFHTRPVPEGAYLTGRLAGALTALALVFAGPALGLLAVTSLPAFPAERLGAVHLSSFVMPYVSTVWPNLLALGTLLFCVAAATRRETAAYAASVLLLAAWIVARAFAWDLAKAPAAALLDPFGSVAGEALRDRLSLVSADTPLPLAGPLLLNRLAWLGVAAAAFAALLARFRFGEPRARQPRPGALQPRTRAARRRRREPARAHEPAAFDPDSGFHDVGTNVRAAGAEVASCPESKSTVRAAGEPARSPVERAGEAPATLTTLLQLARFELARWLASRSFLAALLVLLVVGGVLARSLGTYEGTPSQPLTFLVLGDLANSLLPLSLLFVLFSAGELVWREREHGLYELCDAAPVSSAMRAGAKLAALAGLCLLLLAVIAACGMAGQLSRGQLDLQPGLYARELLGFRLPTFLLFGVLAMAVHALVHQKHVAHVVVAALFVVSSNRELARRASGLLSYASDPGVVYSDFSGYAPFAWPFLVYKAYWAAAAVLLALAAGLLWPRGSDTRLASRLVRLRRCGVPRAARWTAGLAGTALVMLAVFIHRNTAMRNPSEADRVLSAIEYERSYKADAGLPQPRITAVSLRVDLAPRQRAARVRASYELRNANSVPVAELHFTIPPETVVRGMHGERPWTESLADRRLGYSVLALARPLQPEETTRVVFDLELRDRGFRFPQTATAVLPNGTLLMSGSWAPQVGYQPSREVEDPLLRRAHGLGPRDPLPAPDDPAPLGRGARADDERIDLALVVGTDADQAVVAPGRLEREWTEAGRRFFAFRTVRPIWNHYAIASARYDVRRAEADGVALEVFFHPRHGANVDRVLEALRNSLAWHRSRLGPYPYESIRVVEVPRHVRFAGRSYPGLIPVSETGGFLALADVAAGEIDLASSLVTHEVAHQWWGHAVAGAALQGGPFVQETLAQYSRLRALQALGGERAAQRLLEYARAEYFRGHRESAGAEPPLVRVGAQPFVYYDKGLLALHALSHRLGDERLEAALAAYFSEVASRRPPLGTSVDLLRQLRRAAGEQDQAALGDLLERVTTHEAKVVSATVEPRAGRFRVAVRVSLRKLRLEPSGLESEVPPGDWLVLALLDEEGREIARERRFVDLAATDLVLDAERRPSRVVLDPDSLLLESVVDDNRLDIDGT